MPDPVPNPNSAGGKPAGGKPPAKSSSALGALVRAERLMQIAFVLPTAVCVGWLLGYLLDRWLHQHWIFLPGILLGCIAGFIEVFQIIKQNEKVPR